MITRRGSSGQSDVTRARPLTKRDEGPMGLNTGSGTWRDLLKGFGDKDCLSSTHLLYWQAFKALASLAVIGLHALLQYMSARD